MQETAHANRQLRPGVGVGAKQHITTYKSSSASHVRSIRRGARAAATEIPLPLIGSADYTAARARCTGELTPQG